jgi:hypothetical protein
MAIYKPKKIVTKVYIGIVIFLIFVSLFFYISRGDVYMLGVMAGFIIFALIFALVPLPEVITDTNGLKLKKIGRVYRDCQWDWIYDVKTFRSSIGKYITLLAYSEDPAKRSDHKSRMILKDPKGGVLPVSANFSDYRSFLKEVKEKAINARFDETTEKIIKEGMRIPISRMIFWVVVTLFFTAVLLYLFGRF